MTDATTLEERNDAHQVLPAPAAGAKRRRYRWKTAISVMWVFVGVMTATIGVSIFSEGAVFDPGVAAQVRETIAPVTPFTGTTTILKIVGAGAFASGLFLTWAEARRAVQRYQYVRSAQLVALEIGGELVTVPVEALDDHGALVTAEDTDERE